VIGLAKLIRNRKASCDQAVNYSTIYIFSYSGGDDASPSMKEQHRVQSRKQREQKSKGQRFDDNQPILGREGEAPTASLVEGTT